MSYPLGLLPDTKNAREAMEYHAEELRKVMMKKTRCLFITKSLMKSYGINFGLANSAKFVAEVLQESNFETKVVSVIDNNCIDKEVAEFKPDFCFIEALWVVPEKFKELKILHPKVKWIIRVHSKTPFLAEEGIAIDWIRQYNDLGLFIAPNNIELVEALHSSLDIPCVLLGNMYPLKRLRPCDVRPQNKDCIHIACFGALRPMKNTLVQAMAAIALAKRYKKELKFYINFNRIELRGENILKNLRALFRGLGSTAQLIEVPWLPHHEFLDLIKNHIDLGMQVSLTESFNIVTCDFIVCGVPILTSEAIEWMHPESTCDANSFDSILNKLDYCYQNRKFVTELNVESLQESNLESFVQWNEFLSYYIDYTL